MFPPPPPTTSTNFPSADQRRITSVNIVAGTTNTSVIQANATNYEVAIPRRSGTRHQPRQRRRHRPAWVGSLGSTGLATSTITIHGGTGNDTVDLSKFTSDQDVVYDGGANGPAGDTVIFGFAFSAATYAPIFDNNGNTDRRHHHLSEQGRPGHRHHHQCRTLQVRRSDSWRSVSCFRRPRPRRHRCAGYGRHRCRYRDPWQCAAPAPSTATPC